MSTHYTVRRGFCSICGLVHSTQIKADEDFTHCPVCHSNTTSDRYGGICDTCAEKAEVKFQDFMSNFDEYETHHIFETFDMRQL